MTPRQRGWLLPPLAVCFALGILLGRAYPAGWWCAFPCTAGLIAVCVGRGRVRFAACLALFLALGQMASGIAFHPALPEEKDYSVTGVITEELRTSFEYGQQHISTRLSHVTLDGVSYPSDAYWTFYTDDIPEDLLPGRAVAFRARLYHPSGAENPDGYDFREELLRRGITVGLYGQAELTLSDSAFFSLPGVAAGLRHRLSSALVRTLGEEAGGYAAALTLGDRTLIPYEDREAFSRLGIAHILAVSGFHVGIVAGALSWIFRRLRLRQRLRLLLYGILLFLYSALCGFSQPVLRASLLLLLALEGKILNRPRSGLHLLSATFLLLLAVSPVQLMGASFQLTFGAVLGITLVAPLLQSALPFRKGSFAEKAGSLTCIFLAAQIGLLLPELNTYQRLPLLGLILNLPVTLLGSLLILACWGLLLLLPLPFLSAPAGSVLSAGIHWLLEGIRWLGSRPGITLWTPAPTLWTCAAVLLLLFSLCTLFRLRPRVRVPLAVLACGGIALSLLPAPHPGTEYIQFSEGNADAAVLWDRDQVVVLDTGENNGILSGYLRRRRLTPDMVILTHLHTDHAGGLYALVEDEIPIRVLYLPWGAERAQVSEEILILIDQLRDHGTEIRYLSRGDVIPLPSGTATFLWPEEGKARPGQNPNLSSLVTLLRLRGVTLLQEGDLAGTYEMYTAQRADLLKVSHHGSASSTSPAFLEAVSPQVLLLSCNDPARRDQVAERTGDIPLYATATGGALTVHFEDGAFTVETFLQETREEDRTWNIAN